MEPIKSEILILGCGPTGVVLANLLGAAGHDVAVVERDGDVYPIPRATHIDEETMRNLQATGLMPALRAHCEPFGQMAVVNPGGAVLFQGVVADPESEHGYASSHFFYQPGVEQVLRDGLVRYPNVRLHTGVEVESLSPREDGALVQARRRADGAPLSFEAGWVVGCDGGRSVVRARLGVEMESLTREREWVIVDTVLKRAEDAARLPDGFRYILDPSRLIIYAHGFGLQRRWEFQLGEDEPVPSEDTVLEWVARFVDLERVEILRIAAYAHRALIARAWRAERVFLAGDAAHMMPPSAGQGLCSGVRDALNLAWKLDLVLRGRMHPRLLDTYQIERQYHLREVLAGALFIGRLLAAESVVERWWRKWRLQAIHALPAVQAFFRKRSLRRPALREGFLLRDGWGGHHLPQRVVQVNGASLPVDDAIGYRFALLVRFSMATPALREWADARDIQLCVLGVDFGEAEDGIARWMAENQLGFALVRPDRLLFAAGPPGQLAAARAAFDSWAA